MQGGLSVSSTLTDIDGNGGWIDSRWIQAISGGYDSYYISFFHTVDVVSADTTEHTYEHFDFAFCLVVYLFNFS